MKFLPITLTIVILSCFHINYVTSAAQATPPRTNAECKTAFSKKAHNLLFDSAVTEEHFAEFIQRYPNSIATPHSSYTWFVHQGQTLAHFLINQQKYSFVLSCFVRKFGETLNYPSSLADTKRPGSTAFMALCLQSPSPETATLQYELAEEILQKNPIIAEQARPSDGMTPMLAAASAHNPGLMQLIHKYCSNAYYQVTNEGETPASIIAKGRSRPTTSTCLLETVKAAPHLLNKALVIKLIERGKRACLEKLCKQYKLPITDSEIVNAWFSTSMNPSAKKYMCDFILSQRPWLKSQLQDEHTTPFSAQTPHAWHQSGVDDHEQAVPESRNTPQSQAFYTYYNYSPEQNSTRLYRDATKPYVLNASTNHKYNRFNNHSSSNMAHHQHERTFVDYLAPLPHCLDGQANASHQHEAVPESHNERQSPDLHPSLPFPLSHCKTATTPRKNSPIVQEFGKKNNSFVQK